MHALQVPLFHRLSDYLGPWMIEPGFFRSHWSTIQAMDLAAHLREEQGPIVSQMEMAPTRSGSSVAVVPLTGLLMKSRSSMGGTSTVQARKDIRSAANDPNVSGILLGIDSPGGTAAGTDDLANEVRAARKSKPVWAFIEDLGASAAYQVASQAEKIFANSPSALVGSIGTMSVVYDLSAKAEQEGVKTLVFSTGPLKGAGIAGTKITEEQQANFQGIVNSLQTTFDGHVQRGRGLSVKELAAVRTGAVWAAPVAQQLKLIDGIQSLDKTLADLGAGVSDKGRSRIAAMFDLARTSGLSAAQF